MPSTNLTSLYKWGASLCYQKVHGGSMPAAAGPGWERRRANYYVAAISGLPHFGFTASGSTVLDTPANRQTYYIRELVRHIGPTPTDGLTTYTTPWAAPTPTTPPKP